jgi:hypothetical protein
VQRLGHTTHKGDTMFKFMTEIFDQDNENIANFYGMQIEPDPTYKKKLAKAIDYLGDKYLLAKPVEKVQL